MRRFVLLNSAIVDGFAQLHQRDDTGFRCHPETGDKADSDGDAEVHRRRVPAVCDLKKRPHGRKGGSDHEALLRGSTSESPCSVVLARIRLRDQESRGLGSSGLIGRSRAVDRPGSAVDAVVRLNRWLKRKTAVCPGVRLSIGWWSSDSMIHVSFCCRCRCRHRCRAGGRGTCWCTGS